MADIRYPENVYLRIVRAGATGELRVDIHEALDGFFNGITDQVSYVRKNGRSIFLKDASQPVSDLIEEINKATRYGVGR